ncbi:3-(3-hydroxy-phenyl)propionate hydroxylase [Lipingzhangella halophila]|uniref:3-(3-hydroxy-phenyl)propionate hydroxylase n=1 Tax=Lipingzhangella halophila TaxID=1783352 RepID=A0A7W7RER9_9ACTN|nr:bifunctional 3-(3-hydroxy-phenyl)propionate/3-hydroxycinnamic acid hydroxylase [Lipingzhangella halophila]MBB4930610.1 3-(3-hydroxy-phenyl)propionate hydroxylase [Lipingzhangella halophila]
MTIPVVIVGAGPTGLTAAALLGQYGVECLVLDRWEQVYPRPRAVHLDDEVYRLLARLGLGEEFAAISWPCRGLRLVDRDLRVLAQFRRGAEQGRHGYPEANMFDQPDLEAILRTGLDRQGRATIRGNTEVTGLSQLGSGGVRIEVTDRVTGAQDTVLADYVLGCDGANSLVRSAIGSSMRDLKFDQRWLVVDVATDADLAQWEGVHQVCDPRRAATYMRIGRRRYRWEFRLEPGETAAGYRDLDRLHALVAPWTRNIPVQELEIVRAADYTFRAQIADRWRDRRVFLLGDAAHLTPPFIGQGVGAGLRDAANLAWKLAGVLAGTLRASVLDSYEIERKPHARSLIRLAKLTGNAMTNGGEVANLLRAVLLPRLHLVPGLKNRILSSETPPLRRSELIMAPTLGRGLAGRLCPNALLEDGRRFDDVAGGRFAVVTLDNPATETRVELEQRGVQLVTVGAGSALHRWLRHAHARTALVRPDGTVSRVGRDLSALGAAIPVFPRSALES